MTQCLSKSQSAITISVLAMNGGKKIKRLAVAQTVNPTLHQPHLVGLDGHVRWRKIQHFLPQVHLTTSPCVLEDSH